MQPPTAACPASAKSETNDSQRYQSVRRFSERLAEPLSAEDCAVQSMADASPVKWHLAHTTWFFETFLLKPTAGYEPLDPRFTHLFNSYYNAVGEQFARPQRGVLSRPSFEEVMAYRRHVDGAMADLLEQDESDEVRRVAEIGLHHEQQHQELILTDIKHALSLSPLSPVYRSAEFAPTCDGGADWLEFDEGVREIGHSEDSFAFDNESPRHRVFVDAFQIANRPVSCGEYVRFIDDGGYRRPELWLSLGWAAVEENRWRAPGYWRQAGGGWGGGKGGGGEWREFTLAGERPLDPAAPVTHLSYFEADAYARWAGARLPTETQWEVAADKLPSAGGFVDELLVAGHAVHPGRAWEWTASPYTAYPGYRPPDGALGEYNGKFMCNQHVLRGGSCATHSTHIRPTYRNFFPPAARWQFTGLRLCR